MLPVSIIQSWNCLLSKKPPRFRSGLESLLLDEVLDGQDLIVDFLLDGPQMGQDGLQAALLLV